MKEKKGFLPKITEEEIDDYIAHSPRFRRPCPPDDPWHREHDPPFAGIEAMEKRLERVEAQIQSLKDLFNNDRQAVVVLSEQIASLRHNHGLALHTLDRFQIAQNKALLSLQTERKNDLNTIIQLNDRIQLLHKPPSSTEKK